MKNLRTSNGWANSSIALKDRIKSAIYFCLYYSGLEWLLARIIPVRAVAVLMYHGVCEHSLIPNHINFHLPPDIFERQMRALKRRYRVLPLKETVSALKAGTPLSKGVVITFDDGYRNNGQCAAPILNHLGLPFTVFVATAYIGTDRWIPLNQIYCMWSEGKLSLEQMNALRTRLRSRPSAEAQSIVAEMRCEPTAISAAASDSFAMLNWDDVRRMADDGADFGSHTHSHCNMAAENAEQQRAELALSKQQLEATLNRAVSLFAYPYGHIEHMSATSKLNVIATGYDCALSTERGLVTSRSDRFEMPRLGCNKRIWMFTGEILHEMVRQGLRDLRRQPKVSGASGEVVTQKSGNVPNLGR
jgi:peptidoglycan/xylan/chitin deacetylase (PgdA/CDA1 family)